MSEEEAREDACRDYQSSLDDLTFNSKPHINMLTILAEENVQFAKDIVILIEAQIAKAPSSEKLPVMYLMDSIVKNVGREYLAAFSKNLVSTFVNMFEKVDENTRKSLFKLRSTWDEIFPSKKLFALDVRVNSLDPAWPIKPVPPNVNTSSIHVNPKFLNKSPEEAIPPSTSASTLGIPATPNVPEVQKNLTQEQLIRQQLLAKQKQLLELQQKKLELELEQTKAQLAVSLGAQHGIANVGAISGPSKLHVSQMTPHIPVRTMHQISTHPEKSRLMPSSQFQDIKAPTRDPRLNRISQHAFHSKDQSQKKEFPISTINLSENKVTKTVLVEKPNLSKQERPKLTEKIPRREVDPHEGKSKSKSPSPLKNKLPYPKDVKIQEGENTKEPENSKKDPRLRKHLQDKPDEKDDETKDKRKGVEKKEKDEHCKSSEHRTGGSRNKIVNGVVQKQDVHMEETEKQEKAKSGRSSNRKRSRSRSPKSRSPGTHSPKRRERRSPKRRQRSISPSLKMGKGRQSGLKQSHAEDTQNPREERNSNKRSLKPDTRDIRRPKKVQEDRQPDTANQHSVKSSAEPKENLENWHSSKSNKRWKSGWEENKNSQQSEDQGLNKPPHPRHRDSWQNNKGILSPRTPKQQHRLSVDANLQIPKELTSASKADLLKKANERLTSGEITQDEFLVVAHQIRQLFQYQEEKNRYTWDSPTEENKSGLKKKPLLSNAELTYYEHKATLKRTQVQHAFSRSDHSDSDDFFDYDRENIVLSGRESDHGKNKHGGRTGGGQFDRKEPWNERSRRHSPVTGNRPYVDNLPHANRRRLDQRDSAKGSRTNKNYDQRGPYETWVDKNDDFRNSPRHPGRSAPEFQAADREGDGFCDYDDKEEKQGAREEQRPPFSERFLHKRPRYEDTDKVAYIESPGSTKFGSQDGNQKLGVLIDEVRPLLDGPQRQPGKREGQTNKVLEGTSNLSSTGDDPVTQTCMRFEGAPGQQVGLQRFEGVPGQPVGMQRFEGTPGQPAGPQRFEGTPGQPAGPQRFEGTPGQPAGPQRFEGTPGQPAGPQRFEGTPGQPAGPQRFEGTPGQPAGQQRFEGTPGQPAGPQRFEGTPGQPAGPQRFEGTQGQLAGPQRFEGAPGQMVGPSRFEGAPGQPIGLQRFEGGPQRFEGVPGKPGGPQRFEGTPGQPMGPQRFEGAPGQPVGSQRFEGAPGQPIGPQRFEGALGQPVGPQRFEGPLGHPVGPQRFEGPPGQPVRFEGPPGQPVRFEGPPGQPVRFEGPPGQPVRFEGLPGQPVRFEGPPGQPVRFEGPPGQPVRFEGPPGQPVRFEGPPGQPVRFEGPPGQPVRFEGPPGQSMGPQRFEGPPGQPVGMQRFEGVPGPLMGPQRFEGAPVQPLGPQRFEGGPGQPMGLQRFEGIPGQPVAPQRFEGPSGQPVGPLRFEGPLVPRFEMHQGLRFESGPGTQPVQRFEGPMGQTGPRFEGTHVNRFDGQPTQSSHLPRFEGLHGQPCQRFDRPLGQQTPPRFDASVVQPVQPRFDALVPQRFDGPSHQQTNRFDISVGLQGPRFETVVAHPAPRLDTPPYGQTGPYNEPPNNIFNGPSQSMQFQGSNFNGPPVSGVQNFPNTLNRPSGHYFDDKNLHGPPFGNFSSMPASVPVGNVQPPQQVPVLHGINQPGPFNQGQPFLPTQVQNPGTFVQNQTGGPSFPYSENHLGQLDVNELFSKLISTGILKSSQADSSSAQPSDVSAQPVPEEEEEEEDDDQNDDQNIPDLTNFTIEELKQRYDTVINRLYTGIQCYSCGMRFTASQTDVYADHLDWHYRQNRTEKDVSRKITHRRWYYGLTDWIEFEEIADLEERAKSQFFEKVHEEVILKTQEAAKEKEFQSVPAGPAGADESCDICQEQFEQYWDEEEEEWHLKNAIRVEEKIYHPSCYEDYQNTSSFLDCTPSPSKTPVENPLNSLLNIVKQELQEPVEKPKIKEEPAEDTPTACTEEDKPLETEVKTEPKAAELV
ncbi:pre-mRNA cleavage complex 2 protein Pcf11 isoform X2 [Microcaecilia unicolor]|uniref:Pre-mRNA cleavage complex 2 protein Pcf11 n=1 Tax=Microcaecilia unicolor TaxID=1415580 RepID=A0A6P7XZL0_9AMPH|nr:pre-mRNA cleavage complex 2 protein Pcf11 isoform X2 [Microcaecilia unicolor]